MKIVVDHIPKCSSDCIFSRHFSCERRRCILTDNVCVLNSDNPSECHKLTTVKDETEITLKHDIKVNIDTTDIEKSMAKYLNKKGE